MRSERIRLHGTNERLARHAGFWWGLAEGLFFFVVPDVYITFATLFSLRAGGLAWIFSIAGSLVAVAVVFLLQVGLGLDYLGFLASIPGISASLVERVGSAVAARGLPLTPWLVLGGVPLKLYAAQAFSTGSSLGTVLVWAVFARIVRIAPAYGVVGALRLLFRRRIDARPAVWLVAHALFWVGLYSVYFIRMSRP